VNIIVFTCQRVNVLPKKREEEMLNNIIQIILLCSRALTGKLFIHGPIAHAGGDGEKGQVDQSSSRSSSGPENPEHKAPQTEALRPNLHSEQPDWNTPATGMPNDLGDVVEKSSSLPDNIKYHLRLKTHLRRRMTEARASALGLMAMHYGIRLKSQDVAQRFIQRHPRRLYKPNLFVD